MEPDLALMSQPVSAASVHRLLSTLPRLLALGEPTHGSESLLRTRNALFADLVEQHDYRTVAVESDCLAGLAVDSFVSGGPGDLDEVVSEGISHGFGAAQGNRELVQWMRDFNDGRHADDRVHFAGFDGPLEMAAAASPREALLGLLSFLQERLPAEALPCRTDEILRLVGADEQWTEPAAMRNPARSCGQATEAARLRVLADDLAALLAAHTPGLRDDPDLAVAELYARTALGLLRYHHWMADDSAGRIGRMVGERDAMMAGNLVALARRGPTLVHAHNAHLQRVLSSMRFGGQQVGWWSAGALAEAELGPEYRFLAGTVGTVGSEVVEEPPAGTVEGRLQALALPTVLVDSRRWAADLAGSEVDHRVSPWFGYAPLDPSHLIQIDGVVHVAHA